MLTIMELKKALQELADEIYDTVKQRIDDYGFNPRAGKNTLKGSDLETSLKVTPTENGIVLSINPYWEFISRGWKRTGNYNGTFGQFLANVSDWVDRKGIKWGNMTNNAITWKIVMNIWNNGIISRPFLIYSDSGDLSEMLPEFETIFQDWAERLFEELMNEIKLFNK